MKSKPYTANMVCTYSRNPSREWCLLSSGAGPVVRIAPNELSFSSERALRDIHNPGPDGHHYTKRGTSEDLVLRFVFGAKNMLLVDEGEAHKRLRVALQPAFTAKAMRDQQDITNHHVQKTVERLLEAAMNPSQAISLTKELNKLVWGNVGNLAFGEPATLEQLGMRFPSNSRI
jgi:cytochrome P450